MNITDSEQKILSLLWEHGELSTMEIVKRLEEETGWTKHAVISFLRRMEEKGIVKFKEQGRAKFYYANVSRESVAAKNRGSLLKTFYDGKVGLMISEMASDHSLSDEDIRELKDLLDELYQEGKKDGH